MRCPFFECLQEKLICSQSFYFELLPCHCDCLGSFWLLFQAELFILRLSRNSGVLGLAGMAFMSQLFSPRLVYSGKDIINPSVFLVRPLLDFSKDDMYSVRSQINCVYLCNFLLILIARKNSVPLNLYWVCWSDTDMQRLWSRLGWRPNKSKACVCS